MVFVEKLAAAEADETARVHAQARLETYPALLDASEFVSWEALRDQRAARQAYNLQTFVAKTEQEGIVGLIDVGPSDCEKAPWQVYTLYVLRAWHRKKIGSALWAGAGVAQQKKAGVWCLETNQRARMFYEAQNGHFLKREERLYRGQTVYPFVLYCFGA